MKIKLTLFDGREIECVEPFKGCSYVEAQEGHCECAPTDPLLVIGGSPTTHYSTVTSTAGCARCHGLIGELEVSFSTMFGLEEDQRVLAGRPRVY